MQELLGLAEGNPGVHPLKNPQTAQIKKDESLPPRNKMTIAPASGLKGWPKISPQTTLAGLAVIQKEAVHTPKTVIMEKMDYGDMEIKSSLIDRRRQTRDDIVDLPKVELSKLLVPPQLPGDLGIMEGPEGGG